MEKNEKTLYDYLNDIYYKLYNMYLDGKLDYHLWNVYKNKQRNALETIIELEKICQDQTS